MNKVIISVLKYTLFLGIGIGLCIWAYSDVNFNEIGESLKHINWWWTLLSFSLGYLAMVVRGIRWNILLEPMGYKANVWSCIHSVAFGYCMNNLVPRSGEFARCGLLTRSEKIPVDKLFGTVILERVVDVMMMLVFILFAFLTHTEKLSELFDSISNMRQVAPGQEKTSIMPYFLAAAALGALCFWIAMKYFGHLKIVQKVKEFMLGVGHGLKSILTLKRKWTFIFYSLSIWGIWTTMSWTMMHAFAETSDITVINTVFFVVASSLGMLVPTPGGLGSYNIMAKLGLMTLGYSAAAGVLFGTVSWVGKTILELVMGAVGFFVVSRKANAMNKA